MPVDVDVESAATLLLVVLRPVDVELDNAATLLSVVLRPVDREATPLCAVLMPVDVDVDNEVNCPKLTASVAATPSATLVNVTRVVEPAPPSVTFVCDTSSYWTESASPVDSDATLLLVVLKPVDSELIPVEAEVDRLLTPVDKELAVVDVELDKLDTLLLVVLKPVDNELMLVEVDVDKLVN